MGRFMTNESAFGRLMTKIGTLIVINILFAVCYVPFFTVGAALAAMYSAIFDMLRAEEEDRRFQTGAEINPVRAFVRGLRRYGIRASLIWLGLVAVMTLGSINLQVCAQWTGWIRYISAGVIAVMVFASVMAIFMIPVLAWSEEGQGSMRQIAELSVRAAVSRPLQAVLIVLLNVIPLALIGLDELNRPTYAFAGTFFGFALIARFIGKMLLPQLQRLGGGRPDPEQAVESFWTAQIRRRKDRKAEKYLM